MRSPCSFLSSRLQKPSSFNRITFSMPFLSLNLFLSHPLPQGTGILSSVVACNVFQSESSNSPYHLSGSWFLLKHLITPWNHLNVFSFFFFSILISLKITNGNYIFNKQSTLGNLTVSWDWLWHAVAGGSSHPTWWQGAKQRLHKQKAPERAAEGWTLAWQHKWERPKEDKPGPNELGNSFAFCWKWAPGLLQAYLCGINKNNKKLPYASSCFYFNTC